VFFVVILQLFRVQPTKLAAGGPLPMAAPADKATD